MAEASASLPGLLTSLVACAPLMPPPANVRGMGRGPAALLSAALLVVIFATPAQADHCETAIVVYGRPAFTPAVLPPGLPRVCVSFETSGSAGHTLPPATAEIFVRVDANLGKAYPKLDLVLDGLGFRDQSFKLYRTLHPGDTWTYDTDDWLSLPDPEPGGELEASVRFPGGHEAQTHYTLLGVPRR